MKSYEFKTQLPGEPVVGFVTVEAESFADAARQIRERLPRVTEPGGSYFLHGTIDREPQVALAFG